MYFVVLHVPLSTTLPRSLISKPSFAAIRLSLHDHEMWIRDAMWKIIINFDLDFFITTACYNSRSWLNNFNRKFRVFCLTLSGHLQILNTKFQKNFSKFREKIFKKWKKLLTQPSGFHSTRRVNSIPKKTIPRHGQPDHTGHGGTRVQTASNFEGHLGHMANDKGGRGA